jgi:protein-tyrosine phosphatase
VFLHLLAREGMKDQFVVDSAGTGGWHVGRPADRRMRAAAERRGITLPSRARQLDRHDLLAFDRILTMDADNLRSVRALARELSLPAHQLAVIEPITSHCRRLRAVEVPDPYYGGDQGFEDVLDLLEDACAGLLESLRAA